MKSEVKKWIEKDGVVFLTEVGVKKGQTVLDFGSGAGHYTIPLSKVVGQNGRVYALDKNKNKLEKLKKEAKEKNIGNIKIINENSKIPLEDESINTALCYDVVHYESKKKRAAIYSEIYRVSKKGSLFSVYPKHYCQDSPLDELADMDLEGIVEEIEGAGFIFEYKFFKTVLHDEYYNEGHILNFRKP